HLRLANACFVWDPHGAIETISSTPMVKGDFGLDWLVAFSGEFDLGDRVDISRHDVARDRRERGPVRACCAVPDRKRTALLSPREYLTGGVEERKSQGTVKVNHRGVSRLVPEGLHVGGLGLALDLDADIEPLFDGQAIRAFFRPHMDYREVRVLR